MTGATKVGTVIFSHWKPATRKSCGKAVRLSAADAELTKDNPKVKGDYYRLCECGLWTRGHAVMGQDSGYVLKCYPMCQGATGPNCDCPCKGENHGGRYA